MQQKICYIIGAGECSRLLLPLKKEDFVIAVDGGYEYVKDGRVDLAIGDFDSLHYIPECKEKVVLQPEKDDTDTLSGIKEGLKRGYRYFYLYGGLGGRVDHSYANVQCLSYLQKHGARGWLIGKKQVITMISGGEKICFPEGADGYISVFSYGEKAEGVTLQNLKYEIADAVLSDNFPIGVSNEFTGQAASVSVKRGRILVIYDNQWKPGALP